MTGNDKEMEHPDLCDTSCSFKKADAKALKEIEMLCPNSRESFEDNKRFLRRRAEKEENPVIRKLLEKAA